MSLVCKFQVDSVTPSEDASSRTLKMSACVSGSEDNDQWSKWTPSGSFEIEVTNENAFPMLDDMVQGKEYFLRLEECPVIEVPGMEPDSVPESQVGSDQVSSDKST